MGLRSLTKNCYHTTFLKDWPLVPCEELSSKSESQLQDAHEWHVGTCLSGR